MTAPTPSSPPATRRRAARFSACSSREAAIVSYESVTILLYHVNNPENVEAIHGIGRITPDLYLLQLLCEDLCCFSIPSDGGARGWMAAVPSSELEVLLLIEFYMSACRRNMEAGEHLILAKRQFKNIEHGFKTAILVLFLNCLKLTIYIWKFEL
jgi:hypothetical protein